MKNPLVATIIPTYKRPVHILKRAVAGAVEQTYKNLEIIIVNDYPEDKMLCIEIGRMLDGFKDDRIEYIIMEKNSGACAARNRGIQASHSEYIELLDDDDAWCKEKTALQLEAFVNDKVGLVYSPFYNILSRKERPQIVARATISGNVLQAMCYENIAGGCSMTMLSRKAIDDCGLFDERLLSSQDYDLYLRIAKKYEFAYVGKPLTYRYVSEESITKNPEKQTSGWEMFTKKHAILLEKNIDALSYRFNRRVSQLLEEGDFKQAYTYYKRALSLKILSRHNIIEPVKGIGKFLGYKNKRDYKI